MSLPRYAEYKDSGVTWLGEVPAHWLPLKVKAFTRFCGGGTPSRDNLAFWNGDIPWVSPKDMKFERIKGAEESITEDGLSSSSSSLVESGRLLMVVRSGILKHTIPVAINDVPVALNQDMKALTFSEKVATSEFFLRWVQGLNDVLLLAWAKQGATVESIEHSYLAETLVPLPLLVEQSAIAAFLDRETGKIDALIAEQEKLLTLLAEKRQATISHAVTRGLHPNAPMKDSGVPWLGEVPAHWTVTRCGRYLSVLSGFAFPSLGFDHTGNGVRLLRGVNVGVSSLRWDDVVYWKRAPGDGLESYELDVGDVVIGMDRPLIAAGMRVAKVCKDDLPCLLLQRVASLRTSAELEADFLMRYLSTGMFVAHFSPDTTGVSVPHISPDQIGSFVIAIPSIEEQQQILRHIELELAILDRLAAEAERGVALLTERRCALIAAAVTGKIDVRRAA